MSYTIQDIAKQFRDNKKNKNPTVVFTGAGCSKSAGMPLASEIINEINKRFKNNLKDLTDKQRQDYGQCMAKLVPSEQKKLIEKHINRAKINWAHIALASLLKNGYIAKVLTFNFDNILNRACSLDHFFPPVYDLKVLSEAYFSAIPNQSIVHLHGQWSGFELANSDIDTQQQAEVLKNYIKTTINTAPSLFIGYSGGADAFFQLVEENFTGQYRLFWVDYAKEPNANVKKFIEVNSNHRHFIAEQDADKFLLELAIELKCFPTELFKDPIKHLKNICELVNDFPLYISDTEVDILEDTKKTLKIADASKPAITTIKLVENLHDKKFDMIINQKDKLDLSVQPISKIVASAYLGKALVFLSKNNNQFEVCLEKALEIQPKFYEAYAQVAMHFLSKNNLNSLEKAKNYFEKCFEIKPNLSKENIIGNYAVVLLELAQLKNDEILYHQSIEQCKKALEIQPDHANSLNNYGNALVGLTKLNNDESLLHQAIKQYERALAIQPDNVDYLSNYGNAFLELAKLSNNESLLHQAIEQLEKALAIQPDNANTLNNYGTTFLELAKLSNDEILFNKAIEQFEKALEIRPDYIYTMNNCSIAFLGVARLKGDERSFNKAFEQINRTLRIDSNQTYNLACYYALKNNFELSRQNLLHAEEHDNLPLNPFKHLSEDDDLDNVRTEQWFIDLLQRLKEKNEKTHLNTK